MCIHVLQLHFTLHHAIKTWFVRAMLCKHASITCMYAYRLAMNLMNGNDSSIHILAFIPRYKWLLKSLYRFDN